MEDLNNTSKRQHKLAVNNRKNCALTGVTDVVAFDENEVILETDMGVLMIKGHDLHVKRLDLEKTEVDLEGRMDSLFYSEQRKSAAKEDSFFGRLFR